MPTLSFGGGSQLRVSCKGALLGRVERERGKTSSDQYPKGPWISWRWCRSGCRPGYVFFLPPIGPILKATLTAGSQSSPGRRDINLFSNAAVFPVSSSGSLWPIFTIINHNHMRIRKFSDNLWEKLTFYIIRNYVIKLPGNGKKLATTGLKKPNIYSW